MAILTIFLIIFFLCIGFLFLIAPAKRPEKADEYFSTAYAHRGLHNEKMNIPENSMNAFIAACENNYGIELDVQLTADKQLIVFHDANLTRMCNQPYLIHNLTYEELKRYPLPDGSAIPLFSDVLAVINGRVPLLVEVKHYNEVAKTTEIALDKLKSYSGIYSIESFSPFCLKYLKKNAPNVLRGQLAFGGKPSETSLSPVLNFMMKHLLINVIGRPHFIAYGIHTPPSPVLHLIKKIFNPFFVSWTVKSEDKLGQVLPYADTIIFEQFLPKKHR